MLSPWTTPSQAMTIHLAASALAGILYTAASPAWAFGFLATAMVASMIVLIATNDHRRPDG
jgi:hypothetical protein